MGSLIAMIVFGAVGAVVLSGRENGVGVRQASTIFDDDGRISSAAYGASAAYSPTTGTKLAVRTDRGVALVEDGELRYVVNSTTIAAFAWFPGESALLVVEGPTPTGGVVVVQTDGRVRGTLPLKRTFEVGPGMAVLPDGKRAILVELRRNALGVSEGTRLVEVDLTTGEVKDAGEGSAPVSLDDGTVVGDAVGVVDGRWVVRSGLVAEQDGRRHVLGRTRSGEAVMAIHPAGTEAVVVEISTADPRPRRLRLDPPPEEA